MPRGRNEIAFWILMLVPFEQLDVMLDPKAVQIHDADLLFAQALTIPVHMHEVVLEYFFQFQEQGQLLQHLRIQRMLLLIPLYQSVRNGAPIVPDVPRPANENSRAE